MTDHQRSSVESLLYEARKLPPAEFGAFLAGISDDEVRAEVASLLSADCNGPNITAVIGNAAETVLAGSPTGQLIAHFRVLRSLGHGAMGEVYLATDVHLARRVALKLLPSAYQQNSERVRRFEREARAAAALNHPNIVTVYEVGEWEGRSFIAMEYVEGETLAQRLSRGPMPEPEAMGTVTQITDALAAAHAAGIIHRDLKPANVMLRPDGNVKVVDFGLARLLQAPEAGDPGEVETQTQTVAGMVMGTPGYMAPEQWQGKPADARSDVYALGCVLYELLTGRRPATGRTPIKSPALEKIVAKCLEADPADRWQSAADLGRHLRALRPRRRYWREIGLSVGTAVLAWIGFSLWQGPQASALTDKDVLVLADFSNTTGDPVFAGTLRQALALQLEQSPFLKIMEEALIRQDLRLMGRDPGERITSQVAHDICIREAAAARIEGSIASLGNRYVISLQAVACQAGATLARQQIQAADKEHVLEALETAANAMRVKLGESRASIQKSNGPLDRFTTRSLEALQSYAAGYAELSQGRPRAAIHSFVRATELDPQFAMAHFFLAVAYTGTSQMGRGNESMKRAFALVDRVSEYERLIISGRYYWRVTGELNRAVDIFELMKRSHPRWAGAPNELGGLYATTGEFEKSRDEYLETLRLAPRLEPPYRNLASAYIRLDQFEKAKETVEKAGAQQLDSSRLHQRLLELAYLQYDQAAAAREIQWYAGSAVEYDAYAVRAANADALGRRKKAEELYSQAVAAARRRGVEEAADRFEDDNALAEALMGTCGSAKQHRRHALSLALCGETAQVEKLVTETSKMHLDSTLWNAIQLPAIRAASELRRNQPAKAVQHLTPATPYERAYPEVPYLRGLAWLQLGKSTEAVAEFRKILDHKGANWGVFYWLAGKNLSRP